jgi:cytochrome bd-type quinol oxidase subunit 2
MGWNFMDMFIIATVIAIALFQFIHPLKFLKVNQRITKSRFSFLIWIGVILIATFFISGYLLIKNQEAWESDFPLWLSILTIVLIPSYIGFIFYVTFYAFKQTKDMKSKMYRKLLLLPLTPWMYLVAYAFFYLVYKLIGVDHELTLLGFLSITDNDVSLVFKLMLRLILISISVVMIYVFLVNTESISEINNNLITPEENESRRIQIEKRLNWKSLGLAFLVGTMISFLHFAEIDTTEFSIHFQEVYERTLNVLLMIASSLFIPLFLNLLLRDNAKK